MCERAIILHYIVELFSALLPLLCVAINNFIGKFVLKQKDDIDSLILITLTLYLALHIYSGIILMRMANEYWRLQIVD